MPSARSGSLSKPQPFELVRPFGRRIAQTPDANAARKAALDGGLDQGGSDEGHRDRHVDMTVAAFVTRGDLLNPLHTARDDLVQPVSATRDGLDQCCASFGLDRAYFPPRDGWR